MTKYLSLISAIAMLSLITITARTQSVFSDFVSDADGWVIIGSNGQTSPGYTLTGGNPDGNIFANYQDITGTWVYSAPSKFTGNKIGAYDHTVSFDLLLEGNNAQFDDADVILIGGGYQIVYDLPRDTITGWQNYTLILNETAGWRLTDLTGNAPSSDIMKSVLSNLASLKIRGKYSNGTGKSSVDNVYLSVSQSYSNFDTDYEGWRIQGDAQGGSGMPDYHPSGGHPGGYLSATDDVAGGTWYWQAPGKYLGDISASYGQNLKFDLKQSGLNNQYDNYDLILQGTSFNLVFNTPNNPDTTWTSYSIALTENAGWYRGDTTGPFATHSEFMEVISNLQNLYIRGEFIVGDDSGYIDNVSLGLIQRIPTIENNNEALSIFPNPAKESATLRFFAKKSDYFTITLLNESGTICKRQKVVYCSAGNQEILLPLNDLPPGIYLVKIQTKSGIESKKLVID